MRRKGADLHEDDRRAPSEDLALALPKTMCGLMDEEPAKSPLDALKEFGFLAFRGASLRVGQVAPGSCSEGVRPAETAHARSFGLRKEREISAIRQQLPPDFTRMTAWYSFACMA